MANFSIETLMNIIIPTIFDGRGNSERVTKVRNFLEQHTNGDVVMVDEGDAGNVLVLVDGGDTGKLIVQTEYDKKAENHNIYIWLSEMFVSYKLKIAVNCDDSSEEVDQHGATPILFEGNSIDGIQFDSNFEFDPDELREEMKARITANYDSKMYYITQPRVERPLVREDYGVVRAWEIANLDEEEIVVWHDTPFSTREGAEEYIGYIELEEA